MARASILDARVNWPTLVAKALAPIELRELEREPEFCIFG